MICQGNSPFPWTLLAAAFYEGNPVTLIRAEAMGNVLRAAEEKQVTVIYSENAALKKALSGTGKQSLAPGCLRMLITETFWEVSGRAVRPEDEALAAEWHKLAPFVPVNGQGYDGSFYNDCEWY